MGVEAEKFGNVTALGAIIESKGLAEIIIRIKLGQSLGLPRLISCGMGPFPDKDSQVVNFIWSIWQPASKDMPAPMFLLACSRAIITSARGTAKA
jgi:hypothetical protein